MVWKLKGDEVNIAQLYICYLLTRNEAASTPSTPSTRWSRSRESLLLSLETCHRTIEPLWYSIKRYGILQNPFPKWSSSIKDTSRIMKIQTILKQFISIHWRCGHFVGIRNERAKILPLCAVVGLRSVGDSAERSGNGAGSQSAGVSAPTICSYRLIWLYIDVSCTLILVLVWSCFSLPCNALYVISVYSIYLRTYLIISAYSHFVSSSTSEISQFLSFGMSNCETLKDCKCLQALCIHHSLHLFASTAFQSCKLT